jgi:hypothetical protein
MKKISLNLILVVFIKLYLFSQNTIDISKWIAYKMYLSGINDLKTVDYVTKTIEKQQLAKICAYDLTKQEGYVIVDNTYLIGEIKKYIDNFMLNVKFENYEQLELTKDLLLYIYYLRGNVSPSEESKQLPQFIQFGPFTQFSNDLYKIIKEYWIEKHPDAYKNLINTKIELTPEEKQELIKKTSK